MEHPLAIVTENVTKLDLPDHVEPQIGSRRGLEDSYSLQFSEENFFYRTLFHLMMPML